MTEQEFSGVVGRYVDESTPHWPTAATAPAGAPNVVFIVLDDVGFSDLGCFGGEIETPNIDRLAARGLRYNNFHTTALCSPTRACLLTGRNHHSVGMGVVSNWDTGFPGFRGRITKRAGTLAEMLRPNGYNAYAVGKWHLAPTDEMTPVGPYDHWPLQRGFDRFYGFLDGATDQWTPDLVEDNHPIDPPRHEGYHLAEDLAGQSIAMLRDHRSVYPEKPFFLYLCFGAAHYPLHAPPEFIERYRGRYDLGWDALRDERLARQKRLAIAPADCELAPRNADVRAWTEMSRAEQRVAARLMEAYAGFLNHADTQIGRVLDEIERMGATGETVVALLSDNGASGEGGQYGSLNYMQYANGIAPPPATDLVARLDEIGGPTTSPMYATGWAMASNTPLKRYKQNTHAGGIRDPFVISWPRLHAEVAGEIRAQYHHVNDIVPTMLELIGVGAPADLDGVAQLPIEGTSMVPSFAGVGPTTKRTQYYEMLGHRAIWHDGWKAVTWHRPGSSFDDDVWELYHADVDFAECTDLASTNAGKVAELDALWWSEARRYNALPLDDRIMERFLVPKPRPITSRDRFVYYSGIRIPSYGAPDIKNVSYTITATVDCTGLDVAAGGADGTILNSGDRFCGYALFIKDGHLVHDYNAAGTHYVARSSGLVPAGPTRLRYRFTKTGELRGLGACSIDGSDGDPIELGRTLGVHISPAGLSVGWSALSPVSDLFESPFRFGGRIDEVVFDLGSDRSGDPPDSIVD
jgi:arylsulfatase A-like enzyme